MSELFKSLTRVGVPMADLTSHTPSSAMPEEEPWNTIREFQEKWDLNQRWTGILLNCLFTERRHVFVMGRNMFESLLKSVAADEKRGTAINGSQFKDFKLWLTTNEIVKCIREPNHLGGVHRPGLYVLVNPDLLAHMTNEIGRVAMKALEQKAIEVYDARNWGAPTATAEETLPAKLPQNPTTEPYHPIPSNPLPSKPDNLNSPSLKDLVARMRPGLPARKPWAVREEALDRFLAAFKAGGYSIDDWTPRITEEIRLVFMPNKKPTSLGNDAWLAWKDSVESQIATTRGKALGELPSVPERDIVHEQVVEIYAEMEAKVREKLRKKREMMERGELK